MDSRFRCGSAFPQMDLHWLNGWPHLLTEYQTETRMRFGLAFPLMGWRLGLPMQFEKVSLPMG